MKKLIKTSLHWSLAIAVALALKYGLLFCYSAYQLRSSMSPEQRAVGQMKSATQDKPLMYELWDAIVYH